MLSGIFCRKAVYFVIDAEVVAEMKKLIKISKEKNRIVDADEAFDNHPPEGIWYKDDGGRITLKEIEHDLYEVRNR